MHSRANVRCGEAGDAGFVAWRFEPRSARHWRRAEAAPSRRSGALVRTRRLASPSTYLNPAGATRSTACRSQLVSLDDDRVDHPIRRQDSRPVGPAQTPARRPPASLASWPNAASASGNAVPCRFSSAWIRCTHVESCSTNLLYRCTSSRLGSRACQSKQDSGKHTGKEHAYDSKPEASPRALP
jgi:hypothetical protein